MEIHFQRLRYEGHLIHACSVMVMRIYTHIDMKNETVLSVGNTFTCNMICNNNLNFMTHVRAYTKPKIFVIELEKFLNLTSTDQYGQNSYEHMILMNFTHSSAGSTFLFLRASNTLLRPVNFSM